LLVVGCWLLVVGCYTNLVIWIISKIYNIGIYSLYYCVCVCFFVYVCIVTAYMSQYT